MTKSVDGFYIPKITVEESEKIWKESAEKDNVVFALSLEERNKITECLIEARTKTEIGWYENDLSYFDSLKLPDDYPIKWIEFMYDDLLCKIHNSLEDIRIGIKMLLLSPIKENTIKIVEKKYDDFLQKVQASKDSILIRRKK